MAKIDLGSVVGPVGPQGPKPVKGTDYYTEEEKQQFTTETVGLVTTEGTKQTKSVTDEGTKQVQLITEKISEITSTGDLKLNAITTEGKNKLEAVTNEGNRILSEIGKILETSPEGGNALQLGGKTRSEFDKEIQGVAGGYAGKFPLDSAVLDGIYLLPDTGKFYVCTEAFSGKSLIVPDSNFEELSVYKNRERLSNLFEFGSNENGKYFKTNGIVIQWITTTLSPNKAIESGGLIKLKLPISIKYGYSTSVSRQYNHHPLSEGYYTCVPVNTNEIGIRLDEFRNSLDKNDVYYITIIGSPLS